MQKIPVAVKRIHPDAKVPSYGSEFAAGFDLYSVDEVTIEPGAIVKVHTGVQLEIPEGYCWQFWDRSGLGAKGIHRFAGLLDSDYRGEPIVVLHNASKEPYTVEKGNRIIQAAIVPIVQATFTEVDELSSTHRGEKGFHSTGK